MFTPEDRRGIVFIVALSFGVVGAYCAVMIYSLFM